MIVVRESEILVSKYVNKDLAKYLHYFCNSKIGLFYFFGVLILHFVVFICSFFLDPAMLHMLDTYIPITAYPIIILILLFCDKTVLKLLTTQSDFYLKFMVFIIFLITSCYCQGGTTVAIAGEIRSFGILVITLVSDAWALKVFRVFRIPLVFICLAYFTFYYISLLEYQKQGSKLYRNDMILDLDFTSFKTMDLYVGSSLTIMLFFIGDANHIIRQLSCCRNSLLASTDHRTERIIKRAYDKRMKHLSHVQNPTSERGIRTTSFDPTPSPKMGSSSPTIPTRQTSGLQSNASANESATTSESASPNINNLMKEKEPRSQSSKLDSSSLGQGDILGRSMAETTFQEGEHMKYNPMTDLVMLRVTRPVFTRYEEDLFQV